MKTTGCVSERQYPMFCYRNSGVSENAENIREQSDKLNQKFARTISFGDKLSHTIEDLIRISKEFTKQNWDGYGAKPINAKSYENALHFAMSLPSNILSPEVEVTTNGKVLFTWSEGRRKTFSVIIGNMHELSYAGLYGATHTYGIEFFSDCIPETILNNIGKVYS